MNTPLIKTPVNKAIDNPDYANDIAADNQRLKEQEEQASQTIDSTRGLN